MISRSAILLGVVSLTLWPGTWADLHAAETWRSLHTRNFHIVGAQKENSLKEVAVELERFREVVSMLLPATVLSAVEPVRVVIFPNQGAFDPFRPRSNGKRRNVGGYFLGGGMPPYMVINGKQSRGKAQVVFHEYQHFILRQNLNRLPAWLNEGLAEFYRTFEMAKDGTSARLGLQIPRHIGLLKNRGFLPLEKFFSIESGSTEYREPRFYAQSWAVSHYLLLGTGDRLTDFGVFLNALNAGMPLEWALGTAFDIDFKTLNSEIRKYVEGVTLPALTLSFSSAVEFTGPADSTTLSESQKHYYFGDLLARLGDKKGAERHLRQSIDMDPAASASLVSLAALKLVKEDDLTESLLKQAIDADPQNYLAHYYQGWLYGNRGDLRPAVDSYQQSIHLKPNWSRSQLDLGLTLLKLGEEDSAKQAFERAIGLAPYDPFIYYRRSFVLLEVGDNQQAVDDAAIFLRRYGYDNRFAPYMGFVIHFGKRRLGGAEGAQGILTDFSGREGQSEWPYPVYRYLKAELTAEELLSRASDDDKRTEAHAYVGLDLVLEGDTERALSHLTWVEKNGNRRFAEYDIAQSELRRLRAPQKKNGKPTPKTHASPHFSYPVCCGAGIIRPDCVTLGRPPRRTVQ